MLTGAAAAELGVGLDIEALPAWLLRAAVQYLAVRLYPLTSTKLHSTAICYPRRVMQDSLSRRCKGLMNGGRGAGKHRHRAQEGKREAGAAGAAAHASGAAG